MYGHEIGTYRIDTITDIEQIERQSILFTTLDTIEVSNTYVFIEFIRPIDSTMIRYCYAARCQQICRKYWPSRDIHHMIDVS